MALCTVGSIRNNFDVHLLFRKGRGCPTADLCIGKREKTENDLYQKHDWLQVNRDRMQQQFDVGYYEGYMRFKKMYERLMEQFLRGQHD